ncbi:MAG: metallophosphoesterase [Pseudomonadota bacterium]
MNARRLDAVLDRIAALPTPPALLIASGDLTERGDAASYRRLRDTLSALPIPILYALGNHDNREAFASVFPEQSMPDGFLHYAVESGELRLLVLDTLEQGRHGGGFCEVRARWLAERLDEDPDRPTILVLHHPPIESGIGWLTTMPDEPWVRRLAGAIAGRRNLVALLCGHFHRSIAGRFEGLPVIVCPPTAPWAALTLEPFDPDHPDGRPMVVDAPPGYALHLWQEGRLVSHVDRAEPTEPLARFDATMQPLVRRVINERP